MFKNRDEFFKGIKENDRLNNRRSFFTFNEYELGYYLHLDTYLKEYEDHTEIKFIENELYNLNIMLGIANSIIKGKINKKLSEFYNEKTISIFVESFLKDKKANETRPVEQLISTIEKIILFLEFKTNEIQKPKELEPEALDLSDTTATEKIIYLQKLGIIDFLKNKQPFNTSIRSLATVLSAITGANIGTIQPMINPMLSKGVSQKNNPMNSNKPVQKVQKQLNDIGFNLISNK